MLFWKLRFKTTSDLPEVTHYSESLKTPVLLFLEGQAGSLTLSL